MVLLKKKEDEFMNSSSFLFAINIKIAPNIIKGIANCHLSCSFEMNIVINTGRNAINKPI
jgi:hypothetical protein